MSISTSATLPERSTRRGFTLTEIAIVLGIIGMILGAIWVAASSVYNNQRVARATNELLTIAQSVRSLYATSQTVDTTGNADMDVSATNATHYTYLQANVFPSDMMVMSGSPPTPIAAVDPWNGGVAITQATVTNAGDAFNIFFDQVSQGGCIALLTANTGTGRDGSLQAVGAGIAGTTPTIATTTFPVAASVAQGLCTGTKNVVGFEFRLKA